MKTDDAKPESAAAATAPPALSRRSFLGAGATLASAAALLDARAALAQTQAGTQDFPDVPLTEDRIAGASILELQAMLQAGQLTSLQLVQRYRERIRMIDQGLGLRSVLEINPDAELIARQLDHERAERGARGPLHGIPILIKDNIDTGDRMMTTAGSLALIGQPAPQDATVVAKLREAGAVILGKTNLSEWANFRGFGSSSGWSGVGGQTGNPHILDRNPAGSSSGSAAAVSAALCAAALGTETDGSLVCPSGACGVVGIKPTVGLTSRAGVIPISWTQDSVGAHGRTVADAAAVLGALVGVDPRDPATARSAGQSFTDYLQFVNPDGLRGARIGVPRQIIGTVTNEADEVFENALGVMQLLGAEIVDDVELPSFEEFEDDQSEIRVLLYEFKRGLEAYLQTRPGIQWRTLIDIITFNLVVTAEGAYFGSELMELADNNFFDDEEYRSALERGRRLAADEGIDAALRANGLDALVAPTNSPAWPTDLLTGDAFPYSSARYAAVAGYPLLTLPMGSVYELPLGLTFMGTAWSEPTLIRLASGLEAQRPGMRRRPRFLRTFADATRTEAEIRRRNPTPIPMPEGPQPPTEPVRIFWSGSNSAQPRSFGRFKRKPLED